MCEITKHWNIKLNIPPTYIGCHKLAPRVSTSLGMTALRKTITDKNRLKKMLEKVMNSKEDVVVFKLRNGGKLRFYAK